MGINIYGEKFWKIRGCVQVRGVRRFNEEQKLTNLGLDQGDDWFFLFLKFS